MLIGYVPTILGLLAGLVLFHPGIRRTINLRLAAMPSRTFWTWVLTTALILRLLTLLLWPTWPGSDAAHYHAKAMDLFSGKVYGPTAYWPPGLPLLLTAWYRITVPHPVSGYILGIIISTATVLLAFDVARRSLSSLAARWATVLTAIMPTFVFTAARTDASALLAFLVLALADLTLIATRKGWQGWVSALVLGSLLGFASLVKPVFLLVPVILLICWLSLMKIRRTFWRWLPCLGVMVVTILPWTLRNYRIFGSFVLVSTNGGNNLYMGTNYDSWGTYSRQRDPYIKATLTAKEELDLDRTRRKQALQWIKENPWLWFKLMLKKPVNMWGTSSTNIATHMNPALPPRIRSVLESLIKMIINTFWAALLLATFLGTVRTGVWQNRRLWLLLLLLLYMFALHLVFEVQSRYHIPVISALLMVASAGLAHPLKDSTSEND